MSLQKQFRRDTSANINAATPAAGEPAWDTTNNRLRMGDGATAGGLLLVMAKDIQLSTFTAVSAGGTANAITVTLAPDPGAPVLGSQLLIKIGSANTGAVTINQNGHGAVGAKKKASGSLVDLASGDMQPNMLYRYEHDGTYWELMSSIGTVAAVGVSQGNLNTALGSVSASCTAQSSTDANFSNMVPLGTMPGGEYAFGYESKVNSTSGASGLFVCMGNLSTSYIRTAYGINVGSGAKTITAQERYVTASPPFDLGDGDCAGFIFARVNRAGEIAGLYIADVPPWAYNGPTRIRADYICHKTGTKYRRVMRKRSLEEIIGGAEIHYDFEPITHVIKNADMPLIPHPFQGLENPDETIVLLNPRDDRLARIMEHHNNGGDEEVLAALHSGKIYAGNEFLNMKSPPGVRVAPLCFKYSSR